MAIVTIKEGTNIDHEPVTDSTFKVLAVQSKRHPNLYEISCDQLQLIAGMNDRCYLQQLLAKREVSLPFSKQELVLY